MLIDRSCPHCGRPVLEGAVFCLDCGGRILSSATTAGGRRLEADFLGEPRGLLDLTDLPSGDYLFVVEGLDRGRRFDLVGNRSVLGREDADFGLSDPFVSRRHAELRADGQRRLLFDLASANGTYVNDLPADGRELLDGDIIEIGYSTLIFRSKP